MANDDDDIDNDDDDDDDDDNDSDVDDRVDDNDVEGRQLLFWAKCQGAAAASTVYDNDGADDKKSS